MIPLSLCICHHSTDMERDTSSELVVTCGIYYFMYYYIYCSSSATPYTYTTILVVVTLAVHIHYVQVV